MEGRAERQLGGKQRAPLQSVQYSSLPASDERKTNESDGGTGNQQWKNPPKQHGFGEGYRSLEQSAKTRRG